MPIKAISSISDPKSAREILERRLFHAFTNNEDLIFLDELDDKIIKLLSSDEDTYIWFGEVLLNIGPIHSDDGELISQHSDSSGPISFQKQAPEPEALNESDFDEEKFTNLCELLTQESSQYDSLLKFENNRYAPFVPGWQLNSVLEFLYEDKYNPGLIISKHIRDIVPSWNEYTGVLETKSEKVLVPRELSEQDLNSLSNFVERMLSNSKSEFSISLKTILSRLLRTQILEEDLDPDFYYCLRQVPSSILNAAYQELQQLSWIDDWAISIFFSFPIGNEKTKINFSPSDNYAYQELIEHWKIQQSSNSFQAIGNLSWDNFIQICTTQLDYVNSENYPINEISSAIVRTIHDTRINCWAGKLKLDVSTGSHLFSLCSTQLFPATWEIEPELGLACCDLNYQGNWELWTDYDSDHVANGSIEFYCHLAERAYVEGRPQMAASLVAITILFVGLLNHDFPLKLTRVLKLLEKLDTRIGRPIIGPAVAFTHSKLSSENRQSNLMLFEQFLLSEYEIDISESHFEIHKVDNDTARDQAEKDLIESLGTNNWIKLSPASKNNLIDAELKFIPISHKLGMGIKEWGSVAGDYFRTIENELIQKYGEIFTNPEHIELIRSSNIDTPRKVTAGPILTLLKKYPKLPVPLQDVMDRTGCRIHQDSDLCKKLLDALHIRNKAFHTDSFPAELFVRFRSQLFDKGLLRRFIDAL